MAESWKQINAKLKRWETDPPTRAELDALSEAIEDELQSVDEWYREAKASLVKVVSRETVRDG